MTSVTCLSVLAHLLVMSLLLVTSLHAYRVHQMRICIQSVDPSRLPSQCVYCKTRLFPLTVRLCTANTYLPARMTLNEAFCLAATCRRQLPRIPPEPFQPTANGNGVTGNSNAVANSPGSGSSDEANFNTNNEANNDDNYEEAESGMIQSEQSGKIRPPAKFFLGKPQKVQTAMRPLNMFG